MKALTWHGKRDVRVDSVPDPTILHPKDAVIRVTSSGICGSGLHDFEVLVPFMTQGASFDTISNAWQEPCAEPDPGFLRS